MLLKPKHYELWITIKEVTADKADIWETCDPELSDDKIKDLIEPQYPLPKDYKRSVVYTMIPPATTGGQETRRDPRTALHTDLTTDEIDNLTTTRGQFNQKHGKWEAQVKASKALVKDIYELVDQNFLPQLRKHKTARDALLVCKTRYKQIV